jgi:hypothetical protein
MEGPEIMTFKPGADLHFLEQLDFKTHRRLESTSVVSDTMPASAAKMEGGKHIEFDGEVQP